MSSMNYARLRNERNARWLRPIVLSFLFLLMLSVTLGGLVCEAEDNGSIADSNFIRAGEIGGGNITPVMDDDFYRREGVASGDLVFAYVDTSDSTDSIDSVLQVL